MLRIFIPEYIIFIEFFDFNILYDNYFSEFTYDLCNNYFGDNWLQYSKHFRSESVDSFLNNKLWEKRNSLQLNRLKGNQESLIYFSYYILPKIWFKFSWWSRWWSQPISYRIMYIQFDYLNFNVGNSYFYYNSIFNKIDNINYIKMDMYLLFDVAGGIWTKTQYAYMENYLNKFKTVLYRIDPYKYEFLIIALRLYYKKYFLLSTLNPYCVCMSDSFLFARKWTIYVYMAYNNCGIKPHVSHWYLLSDYFSDKFKYQFITFDERLFLVESFNNLLFDYIIYNYWILKCYFIYNYFIFSCLIYFYFCNKKNLYLYIFDIFELYTVYWSIKPIKYNK